MPFHHTPCRGVAGLPCAHSPVTVHLAACVNLPFLLPTVPCRRESGAVDAFISRCAWACCFAGYVLPPDALPITNITSTPAPRGARAEGNAFRALLTTVPFAIRTLVGLATALPPLTPRTCAATTVTAHTFAITTFHRTGLFVRLLGSYRWCGMVTSMYRLRPYHIVVPYRSRRATTLDGTSLPFCMPWTTSVMASALLPPNLTGTTQRHCRYLLRHLFHFHSLLSFATTATDCTGTRLPPHHSPVASCLAFLLRFADFFFSSRDGGRTFMWKADSTRSQCGGHVFEGRTADFSPVPRRRLALLPFSACFCRLNL